jgi:glucosylceramidase
VVSNAGQYVDTIAWHCYANPLDWTVLSNFHDSNSGVTQYMTECYTPQGGDGSWPAGFTMGPLQNWASGVAAWNLGADSSDGPNLGGGCTNCEGIVTVNNGEYTLNVAYYMLAQFSKFIPIGAQIVSGSGSYSYSDGTGVQSVASVNPDGSRTVVIQNDFSNDVYVTVNTTSGQWSGNAGASGLTTWVLPSS